MAFLEITHLSGEIERRSLEKRQPVSIGSHSSNDIQVDEETVEPMHCRVSWNKQAFEAVSAGVDGLDVNGTVVQRAILKPGDVLRFGSVDVRFCDGDPAEAPPLEVPAATAGGSLSEIDLKPLSGEMQVPDWLKAPSEAKPAEKAASKAAAPPSPPPVKARKEEPSRRSSSSSAPAPKSSEKESRPAERESSRPRSAESKPRPSSPSPREEAKSSPARSEPARPASKPSAEKPRTPKAPEPEFDLDAGLEALAMESRDSMPVMPPAEDDEESPPSRSRPSREERKARKKGRDVEEELVEDAFDTDLKAPAAPAAPVAAAPAAGPSDRVRSALRHQRSRPGEEDIMKSPLVLGLTITAVVALLLTGIFYFIGVRRSTQEEFDFAKGLFTDQKYAQAITELGNFITRHPDHGLRSEAGRLLGQARIDQLITGAAPNFESGMKLLKDYIGEQRDLPDFAALQPEIAKRAGDVAMGSATQAGKVFKKELLDVSREAKSTLVTFSAKEAQPTELLREIDAAVAVSEQAILKHDTHLGLLAQIDEALKASKPLDALKFRRELLARYADLETDKTVVEKTAAMLETERTLVKDENFEQAPITDPVAGGAGAIRLLYQARTRTDQVSVDRATPVVAADSVFGIDTMTGAPVWRQQVGVDGPFFPLRDASTSSLIMFDSVRQELLRVDQNTGKVIWRQLVAEPVSSRPLLDEGQIFLPTTGGRLYRFDLETGAAGGRLTFSQEISNPVALVDGKRLVVAGDREVFYTITKRPFACVGVSYLGQPSGSIAAIVLSMGPYVLAAENHSDSCRLRLLTTEPADQPIREVATQDVGGQVVDAPVVRGRDLFVPSTGERVFTFQLSDDPGQPPMSAGPTFEVKGAKPSTTYLAAAPDGELFMASTALRKLQLSVDTLQPTQEAILKGSASQPLQSAGATMFVARQRQFSEGVVYTPIDRSSLSGDWQVIAGSPILATSVVSGTAPSAVSVTDAGQIFRVTTKLLETGGFLSVAERLQLHDDMVDPLLATPLAEGQVMVTSGPPEPKLWFINRLGQVERTLTLQVPMQAAPALLGNRVLAPVSGGIQVLQGSSAQQAAQEFRLPGEIDPSSKWKAVYAVGEDQGIGVLNTGILFSVRLQKSPKAHLAEAGRFSLDAPVAGKASFSGAHLAVASANGRVVAFDAERLEPLGERQYPSALSGGPWLAGDLVLVEVGGTELQALGLEADLPERWKLPLEGDHVAGTPLVLNGNVLIAMQNGRVLACEAASGDVKAEQTVSATAADGPLLIGTRVYIPTLDGALVPADGGQQ